MPVSEPIEVDSAAIAAFGAAREGFRGTFGVASNANQAWSGAQSGHARKPDFSILRFDNVRAVFHVRAAAARNKTRLIRETERNPLPCPLPSFKQARAMQPRLCSHLPSSPRAA